MGGFACVRSVSTKACPTHSFKEQAPWPATSTPKHETELTQAQYRLTCCGCPTFTCGQRRSHTVGLFGKSRKAALLHHGVCSGLDWASKHGQSTQSRLAQRNNTCLSTRRTSDFMFDLIVDGAATLEATLPSSSSSPSSPAFAGFAPPLASSNTCGTGTISTCVQVRVELEYSTNSWTQRPKSFSHTEPNHE
jgi:hypothetical protein